MPHAAQINWRYAPITFADVDVPVELLAIGDVGGLGFVLPSAFASVDPRAEQ